MRPDPPPNRWRNGTRAGAPAPRWKARERGQRRMKSGTDDDRATHHQVLGERGQSEFIIAASESMKRVLRLVEKIAPTETTVLVTGESGTGKEKVARFLHLQSLRASRPFVAVNAAAMPEGLIESELFGHVRGAFTDARERKRGVFEMADGGTLFLDEIAETSPQAQVKLLRVLQEREIRPVGADFNLKVDVRILA